MQHSWKMETLQSDIAKIKRLIKEENKAEIKKLSSIFLPEYNLKIVAKLDPWERNTWMNFVGYN